MISVALAIHNEAKNLPRCLNSVKSWADEIIIVDGESIDDSVEVAKKLGAQVIKTTNKLNFHINKQMAIDACTGNLILQLDADEVVDGDLAQFVQDVDQAIARGETLPFVAWQLRRKNYFLGAFLTKGGQYPDPVIRLFLAGKARLPQQDVHEQMKVDGEVGWATGHLIHYSNPSFEEYIRKFNVYTSFRANQWQEEGMQITLFNSIWWVFIKPLLTFLSLFFRHKGLYDGIPGLAFAMWSGLHFAVAYIKLWELKQQAV